MLCNTFRITLFCVVLLLLLVSFMCPCVQTVWRTLGWESFKNRLYFYKLRVRFTHTLLPFRSISTCGITLTMISYVIVLDKYLLWLRPYLRKILFYKKITFWCSVPINIFIFLKKSWEKWLRIFFSKLFLILILIFNITYFNQHQDNIINLKYNFIKEKTLSNLLILLLKVFFVK